MSNQNAITISNLMKIYSNDVIALNNVTFSIKKGEFFGLLGPNGAGKSTTIGILSSLVKKTSGKLSIFGYNTDVDHLKAKALLGIVPQEFNFNIFETPLQIVINQAGYYGVNRRIAQPKAEQLLQQLGIWNKRSTPSISLSGGQKRRLMIARALIHEPKLLILDEPTAGIDIVLRHTMWSLLKRLNKSGITIILTTHYLEEAENLCNKIGILDKGELIALDKTRTLLKRLNSETIILYCNTFDTLPKINNFKLTAIENGIIEAEISEKNSITILMKLLEEKGIHVKRFKNKKSRLEELYMNMVNNK